MATSKNDQINKTEDEWRENLTDEQFCVLRQHGTERPASSPLDKQYDEGTYVYGFVKWNGTNKDTGKKKLHSVI